MTRQLSEHKSVWVNIKLEGEAFTSDSEFDVREDLEEMIIDSDFGEFTGAGSGGGWMDVSFRVDNEAAVVPAIEAVKAFLSAYPIPEENIRFDVHDVYD